MGKLLLITRPNHDITTRYLFAWNESIINLAIEKRIEVIDLKKGKANRNDFEGRVKKLDPAFIVMNGHGSDYCVTGHDNEVLIEAGKNEELLNSKITYALSCNSASLLGVKSIEAGATCYIGYNDEFIFCHQNKTTRPLEDNIACLFLDPSNQLVISLLKGNMAKEAVQRSKNLTMRTIHKLLSSASSNESAQYVKFLWWNMSNQVCLGEQEATF